MTLKNQVYTVYIYIYTLHRTCETIDHLKTWSSTPLLFCAERCSGPLLGVRQARGPAHVAASGWGCARGCPRIPRGSPHRPGAAFAEAEWEKALRSEGDSKNSCFNVFDRILIDEDVNTLTTPGQPCVKHAPSQKANESGLVKGEVFCPRDDVRWKCPDDRPERAKNSEDSSTSGRRIVPRHSWNVPELRRNQLGWLFSGANDRHFGPWSVWGMLLETSAPLGLTPTSPLGAATLPPTARLPPNCIPSKCVSIFHSETS